MKASREMLEGQLERYEEQLAGLKSFIKELKDRTAEHGTPREHFEEDLIEAEHNIKFYEAEIARIREETGAPAKAQHGPARADTILPRTARQGLGSLILSSISFVTGAIIGSKLKSRGSSPEREDKQQERR